jgi:hypothetical protein
MTGPMPQATPIEAAGYAMLAEKDAAFAGAGKSVSQSGGFGKYLC